MKKITLILFFWGMSLALFAQFYVAPITENYQPKNQGFYFVLPKTLLKVDVVIEAELKIQGPFTDFAEQLLGLNVINNTQTNYKLKKVTLDYAVVPDSNRSFFIELSKKQNSAEFLEKMLTPKPDVFKAFDTPNFSYQSKEVEYPEFFKRYTEFSMVERIDTVWKTVMIDSIETLQPTFKKSVVTKPVSQKAQEAANFILQIRQNRYDLLSGSQEVAYSKETIEYLINELTALENNHQDLFTGITILQEEVHTLYIDPANINENQEIDLFGLDKNLGFSTKLYPDKKKNYSLRFDKLLNPEPFHRFAANTDPKKSAPTGVPILQAVPTNISLINNMNTLISFGIYPIYQFGILSILNIDSGDFDLRNFGFIY